MRHTASHRGQLTEEAMKTGLAEDVLCLEHEQESAAQKLTAEAELAGLGDGRDDTDREQDAMIGARLEQGADTSIDAADMDIDVDAEDLEGEYELDQDRDRGDRKEEKKRKAELAAQRAREAARLKEMEGKDGQGNDQELEADEVALRYNESNQVTLLCMTDGQPLNIDICNPDQVTDAIQRLRDAGGADTGIIEVDRGTTNFAQDRIEPGAQRNVGAELLLG